MCWSTTPGRSYTRLSRNGVARLPPEPLAVLALFWPRRERIGGHRFDHRVDAAEQLVELAGVGPDRVELAAERPVDRGCDAAVRAVERGQAPLERAWGDDVGHIFVARYLAAEVLARRGVGDQVVDMATDSERGVECCLWRARAQHGDKIGQRREQRVVRGGRAEERLATLVGQ